MMELIFDVIRDNNVAFLAGLTTTLKICSIVWLAGLLNGSALALLAYKLPNPFYYIFTGVTLTVIAIPLLVILYWFHYPFQLLIGRNIDPFYTAILTLSLLNSLLTYQILISSLRAFPSQYLLASTACGLSQWQTIKSIQMPIILRQFIPGFMMLQVFMLQSSIFASNISVQEIFRKAQQINAMIKQPIEVFSAMALFFILVCLPLYSLAFWLRKRYSRDISES
jgi:ABC-type amino acid transport system permease subunit